MNRLNKICVYCGSNPGKRSIYTEQAKKLGELLVQKEIELVYGGASVGVMSVIADAVINNGGRATGIIPKDLLRKEVAHQNLSELQVVASMHERKARMADISDGFIALPGGLGTVEELFEMLTWAQLGFHQKPVGILNAGGYFDHLSTFLDHAVAEQFVKREHRKMLMIEEDPATLIDAFEQYESPVVEKWIDREGT